MTGPVLFAAVPGRPGAVLAVLPRPLLDDLAVLDAAGPPLPDPPTPRLPGRDADLDADPLARLEQDDADARALAARAVVEAAERRPVDALLTADRPVVLDPAAADAVLSWLNRLHVRHAAADLVSGTRIGSEQPDPGSDGSDGSGGPPGPPRPADVLAWLVLSFLHALDPALDAGLDASADPAPDPGR